MGKLRWCVARRLSIIAVAAAAAAGAWTGQAQALDLAGSTCGDETLQQPFLAWGDPAEYTLAPGGSFEPGDAAWTLDGGANVSAGNEPWYVHDPGDSDSLELPPGSSATSPATCIGIDHPTLRFFAKGSGGALLSNLQVDVLFTTPLGTASLPVGTVLPTGAWAPSPAYLLLVNNLAILGGQYSVVAFRFVPVGSASWQVDDVYVDPWRKG